MKRSKHSLSHYKLLTCDMGRLVPIACFEVLPGDTVQQATSLLLRCSPLVAPVMHPVTVRVHHWFVPHRLLWDNWEKFITGVPDEDDEPYVYPKVTFGPSDVVKGSLADHLGVPPGNGVSEDQELSPFPFMAYQMIWREFYMDQDLQPVPDLNTADPASQSIGNLNDMKWVCWEKDYFTSARPWPQKGPDITLPLGSSAPVVGTSGPVFNTAADPSGRPLGVASPDEVVLTGYASTTPAQLLWQNPNLTADLSAATSVNVNDVRLAFALQRYQEARARYGSRYTEYLRYLGVRSSDARLQRPEYLGGGKQTIAFSEVLQTGPNAEADPEEQGVGTLRGHGISAMRSRRYRRFFEEHGFVLTLLSVRPRSMYGQYLPKLWTRETKEDFWQKELEQIGQQQVITSELYGLGTTGSYASPFGYQDRYAEYRHQQSTVSGDFRDTLNYWHLARQFSTFPVLQNSFVRCEPTKRIFAEQTADSLWLMANHSIQARRLVSRSAFSRIL